MAASTLIALGLVSTNLSRAGSGPLTYAYDALGRLVAVVDGSGAAAQYKVRCGRQSAVNHAHHRFHRIDLYVHAK